MVSHFSFSEIIISRLGFRKGENHTHPIYAAAVVLICQPLARVIYSHSNSILVLLQMSSIFSPKQFVGSCSRMYIDYIITNPITFRILDRSMDSFCRSWHAVHVIPTI